MSGRGGIAQIAGLQRSGTRWLAMLVANNYSVDVSKAGKHDTPSEYGFKDFDMALVIFKRFDRWLNSILRNPVNLPETRPTMYTKDGSLLAIEAANIYDSFYSEWQEHDKALLISYEALLRDPIGALDAITRYCGWRRSSETWQNGGPQSIPEWRKEMYLET